MINNKFPKVAPSLNLNFAQSQTLDHRITFSRASSATYFDRKGILRTAANGSPRFDFDPVTGACKGLLIEEQRTNLLQYSEQFDNAAWKKTASLTVNANTHIAPDGTLTANTVTSGSASQAFYQDLPGISTTGTYTMSMYFHTSSTETVCSFVMYFIGASTQTCAINFNAATATLVGQSGISSYSISTPVNGWYRVSITCTGIDAANTLVRFSVYANTPGSSLVVWGAQIEQGSFLTSYIPSTTTFTSRASTATYFGSDGLIKTAAVNEARLNYNPADLTIAPKLLLEEQRTNFFRNSQMDGAAVGTLPTNWAAVSLGGISWSVVGVGTEIGVPYIDVRFNGTATSDGWGIISHAIAAVKGKTFTYSLYTKIIAGSTANLTNIGITLNELDAASTYLDGRRINIKDNINSNIKRYNVTRTIVNDNTAFIAAQFDIMFLAGAVVDITIRIAAPQLEEGSYPTSYIPTTTSQVTRSADISTSAQTTRNADVASMTGVNFSSWYRQDEGTVVCEFDIPNRPSDYSEYTRIWSINGGSGTTEHSLLCNSGWTPDRVGILTKNLTLQFDTTVTAGGYITCPVTFAKHAYSYKSNDFAAVYNGGSAVTDTSGSIPATSMLNLGNYKNTGDFMNGHIARLAYYPKRLSNNELQALTS